ncbi:MAK10-like protein [Tanacetum coccineum]
MASQDARLSKFEADFEIQQSEMTNKIDTFLKAINDRMTGALPNDTIKNPKLNVNSTSSVLSARSYPTKEPQSSSYPLNSINAIKTCSKETNNSQKDQLQTVIKIRTSKPKEPEKTLEDEFKDLHLNLPVLEFLAHASMYNTILDKYVESLELGKNGFAFIQGKIPKKMKDPGLFTLPCRLGESTPFDTLADLGLVDGTKSYLVGIVKNVEVHIGRLILLDDFYVIDMDKDPATLLLVGREFLATANAVIDCSVGYLLKKVGARTPYYAKNDFTDYHLPGEWEIARDVELNPFKDVLVFKRMVLTSLRWRFLILYQAYGNLYATTGRKALLLEDKQIPSVGVFDEVSFYTLFQGYTRDLDSIWEETGQDCNFTRSGLKNRHTVPGDGVAIPNDTVRTYKRRRQDLCDSGRMGLVLCLGDCKTLCEFTRPASDIEDLNTDNIPPFLVTSKGDEKKGEVIMEYLMKDSKRRAFWSLNEDILKITILKTNTPYPSRKIRRIRTCTHQRQQRNEAQYALLPYGLQKYLDLDVAKPIIKLCSFFKQICARTLMEDDMVKDESQLINILCNLEQIYPPTFFDIMIHFHLPEEALEGGPIPYRWMYPFERYMKKLKKYVRNKAKPEAVQEPPDIIIVDDDDDFIDDEDDVPHDLADSDDEFLTNNDDDDKDATVKISPPKDAETPVESPIPISPSSSVGSSSPFRSTTPPPDYPFDKSILDNSLWIIPQPLGSEPVPKKPNESDAC